MARKKQSQVSFYEICDEDGNQFDTPFNWRGFMAELASETIEQRSYPIYDVMTRGEVYPHQGERHLVLARQRDSVSTFQISTGQIVDHDADANNPWVEISVIHFLPDSNKIGFVQCSASSPRIASLQEWLNTKRFSDKTLTIQPVFDRNTIAKLRGAASASLIRVSFSPGQALDMEGGGLYGIGQTLQRMYGDVTVSLELKIEGKRPHDNDSAGNILSEVKNLTKKGGGEFKKAVANVLRVDEISGREKSEMLNFVDHRLTKKVRIEIVNKDESTVRIVSVLEAIYKAADQLKNELHGV